jgi:hypothetical protein
VVQKYRLCSKIIKIGGCEYKIFYLYGTFIIIDSTSGVFKIAVERASLVITIYKTTNFLIKKAKRRVSISIKKGK